MKENGVSTLRFTFEGAGCCGPSYGINLGEAQENDVTETVNGIEVAMDPKVFDIVNTLTLDYVEDAGQQVKTVRSIIAIKQELKQVLQNLYQR
ncbi:adhesin [Bacillus cereus]|nr:adhesin [Bacillus cereus]